MTSGSARKALTIWSWIAALSVAVGRSHSLGCAGRHSGDRKLQHERAPHLPSVVEGAAWILFALVFFLRKMRRSAQVTVHRGELRDAPEELDPFGLTKMTLTDGVEVFEIEGPFFFGAAEPPQGSPGL